MLGSLEPSLEYACQWEGILINSNKRNQRNLKNESIDTFPMSILQMMKRKNLGPGAAKFQPPSSSARNSSKLGLFWTLNWTRNTEHETRNTEHWTLFWNWWNKHHSHKFPDLLSLINVDTKNMLKYFTVVKNYYLYWIFSVNCFQKIWLYFFPFMSIFCACFVSLLQLDLIKITFNWFFQYFFHGVSSFF